MANVRKLFGAWSGAPLPKRFLPGDPVGGEVASASTKAAMLGSPDTLSTGEATRQAMEYFRGGQRQTLMPDGTWTNDPVGPALLSYQLSSGEGVDLTNLEIAKEMAGRRQPFIHGTLGMPSVGTGGVSPSFIRVDADFDPDATMTAFRPRDYLARYTGSEARADELIGRIAERNKPYGEDGASIFYSRDFANSANRPALLFQGENLMDGTGTGHWVSGARQAYVHAPDAGARRVAPTQRGLYTLNHELVHSILDPDPKFVRPNDPTPYRSREAAIGGIGLHPLIEAIMESPEDRKLLTYGQFLGNYAGGNLSELNNVGFHAKRAWERFDPSMPDVGESPDTIRRWLDLLQQTDPAKVPGELKILVPAMQDIMDRLKPGGRELLEKALLDTGAAGDITTGGQV